LVSTKAQELPNLFCTLRPGELACPSFAQSSQNVASTNRRRVGG